MRISDCSSDVCSSDLKLGADIGLADIAFGRGQIAEQLADHILVARLFEIGLYHRLAIGVRLFAGQAHQPGRPFAQQAIAPRRDLEGVFLVKSRSEEHTSELKSLMRISYAVFCL